jgi:heptosyltransferase-2
VARRRVLEAPPGGFRSIAVLRLSSLGDVVLALPVAQALRAAFPAARTHFWVKEEYADVVRWEPSIDHVRVLEKDARRLEDLVSMSAELEDCDLIVDLHGNARTRVLAFRQRAPVLRAPSYRVRRARWVHARWSGPPPVPRTGERYAAALAPLGLPAPAPPRMSAGPQAEAWAGAWMAAWAPGAAPVALCPGARHATKRWPEARWCELDAALAARGCPRVVIGTAAERRALPELAARVEADPLARWLAEPLPRVAAVLSRCAGAVAHDSGLMHVAAARGLRVVAIFGSTSPDLGFAPAGEGHVVLCRREPCQPCTLHGRPTCPQGHFRCMTGIAAGEVLAALDRVTGAPA